MLAEIGDITRFPSARKLASWAGLTPTVRGSDLTVRHGHISKQGSAWLRWVLNQAAQTAKRSPEFAATCSSIARTPPGKKIATIAISRKLDLRAYLSPPRPIRPPASSAPPRTHSQIRRSLSPGTLATRHGKPPGRARSSD